MDFLQTPAPLWLGQLPGEGGASEQNRAFGDDLPPSRSDHCDASGLAAEIEHKIVAMTGDPERRIDWRGSSRAPLEHERSIGRGLGRRRAAVSIMKSVGHLGSKRVPAPSEHAGNVRAVLGDGKGFTRCCRGEVVDITPKLH